MSKSKKQIELSQGVSHTIYTMNLNFADYIELKTNVSENNIYFLVDSQADISVIKLNSLNGKYKINVSEQIEIRGVVPTPIKSLGCINIELFIENFIIIHKFHVMPNDFNIPCDAILGKDFIKPYRGILDYGDQTFTVRTELGETIIPMKLHTQNDEIVVPPRSEIFRTVKIKETNFPIFIPSTEVKSGVFTANTIAHKNETSIRIMNITDSIIKLDNPTLEYEPLCKYNIYTMNTAEHTSKRTTNLIEKLKTAFPNDKKLYSKLKELCSEFSDIFALDTDNMTVNNFYEQKLTMKDTEPVYTKNYRIPMSQKEEINKQVNKLIENNLIEPSKSCYNSPIILVPKKGSGLEKKWRMCIDYRKVNVKLIADRFPLPRIDEILDNLGRAKYFSTIDLYSGFHQVALEPNSRDITTFSTEKGSFRWKVLPFGLNVSPNSFSRMMSIAFSGLPPDRAFLYIDDIIVIGKSEENHFENLRSVFEILKKFNLKINPEKCRFFQAEVTFLGHKCTAEGILPDDTKIKSMKNYPTPHDKDSTKRFVAFANYYRKFIHNFAELAQPLSKLTQKRIDFNWGKEQECAFNKLKNALIKPNILQYPDFTKEFILKVDSSTLGCGGILLQNHNGIEMSVAYYSKTFQKGEKNKAIIEKELLAIFHSIIAFRPYLYGKHFTVYSDHKPLVYLFTMRNPASKLVRIKLELEEYDFDIVHIRGKENILADALSRIPFSEIQKMGEENKQILAITRSMSKIQEQTESENKKIDEIANLPIQENLNGFNNKIPRIKTLINNDELRICAYQNKNEIFEIIHVINEMLSLHSIISMLKRAMNENNVKMIQWPNDDLIFNYFNADLFKNECIKVMKNEKIIFIDKVTKIERREDQLKLITEYHNDRIRGGHCGQKRLYAKLRNKYYWKGMTKDIAKFVRGCIPCMKNKPKRKTRETMEITPTPIRPFDVVIIDTIGPMAKTTSGNVYALTIICELSKYLIMSPMPNKEAKTVAKTLFENLILIYGTPKVIRTDLGTEYRNEIIEELCKLCNIKHNFSTAYHHESLGSIERSHRVFNEYLRSYINNDEWDTQLGYFCYCYNTSFHSSLNHEYTPFELIFGKRANDIEAISRDNFRITPVYNIDNYIKIIKYNLELCHKRAHEFIKKFKMRNKNLYDKNSNSLNIKINDMVLVKQEPYHKFKPVYSGPFKVDAIDGKNITINLNDKPYQIHKNRVVKYEA